MVESSNLITFTGLTNSSGYDTFLLDEERGRLLVGAEDHVFSFDLVNLNREHKQVRVLLFDRTQGQHYEDSTMTTRPHKTNIFSMGLASVETYNGPLILNPSSKRHICMK